MERHGSFKKALVGIYDILKKIYLDIILLVIIPIVYSRITVNNFNENLNAFMKGNQSNEILRQKLMESASHSNRFPIIYIAILLGIYLYRYDKSKRGRLKKTNRQ